MNRILTMVLRNLHIVPGAWFKLCHYAKHTDEYPELEKWRHIQYILGRAVKSGNIELKVTGLENIPTDRSFLLYSNHQGMFDVLAIAATCDPPLGTVLKKELKDVPFLKQIVACTKSFAMDREDVRQSLTVIQSVIKEINDGRNYLIFPEGTRSKSSNDLLEFHNGSFRCALKTKCTVVPVALVDCYKVLDQKGSKPVTVQIHYLPPIEYDEYQAMNTKELAALVRDRIEQKIVSSL
ncbi:MAG: 1-acyl-sn-glycerol-3-phosphate acyltransferase [Oscillospiraceae bacterium]|nr:1-acyl-sn-glycerol-3-phosphate acyltransferase [Oscillospiraceae bacterium]